MRLIKQRKFGECGIACLAMITGCDYDEIIREIWIDRNPGKIPQDDIELIGVTNSEMVSYLESHSFIAKETTDMNELPPAIITVASLNFPGLLHYIIWTGDGYLDPAEGPKMWPDDAPIVNGKQIITAASAIIFKRWNNHSVIEAKEMKDDNE